MQDNSEHGHLGNPAIILGGTAQANRLVSPGGLWGLRCGGDPLSGVAAKHAALLLQPVYTYKWPTHHVPAHIPPIHTPPSIPHRVVRAWFVLCTVGIRECSSLGGHGSVGSPAATKMSWFQSGNAPSPNCPPEHCNGVDILQRFRQASKLWAGVDRRRSQGSNT
jgi:hypothetical protein